MRSSGDPQGGAPPGSSAAAGAWDSVRLVTALVGLAIALLALLGALEVGGVLNTDGFDVNEEHNIPTAFSAMLLAASAGIAIAYSAVVHPGERHAAGLLMASILAFMSLDEVATIHEGLEARVGVDWETLYLPIALVAGAAWLLLLRELLSERRLAVCWSVAAGAWVAGQLLEFLEYDADDRRVRLFGPMTVVEETLEMAGSALFGLSLLLAIVIVVRRRGNLHETLGR